MATKSDNIGRERKHLFTEMFSEMLIGNQWKQSAGWDPNRRSKTEQPGNVRQTWQGKIKSFLLDITHTWIVSTRKDLISTSLNITWMNQNLHMFVNQVNYS